MSQQFLQQAAYFPLVSVCEKNHIPQVKLELQHSRQAQLVALLLRQL